MAGALGWRAVMALPILGLPVLPFLWRALVGGGTGARLDVLGAVLVAATAAWFALLIAVPAVLVGDGWQPWQVGLVLVPSAVVALVTPRVAGPLLNRVGATRSLALSGLMASAALAVSAAGAVVASATVLVAGVAVVTVAFGLGQPALSAAVGGAVDPDVRGVALGVATLLFLIGGSVGSAVVGGLGGVWGVPASLLVLAVLPLLGLVALLPELRRVPAGSAG